MVSCVLDLGLEGMQALAAEWERASAALVEKAQAFARASTPANWVAASAAMETMLGFKFIQIFVRSAATILVAKHAAETKVARCHFEQFKENLLLRCHQLDEAFAQELASLAKVLSAANIDKKSCPSWEEFQQRFPAEATLVDGVTRKYKFAKEVDISMTLPHIAVLQRALGTRADYSEPSHDAKDTEFFPEALHEKFAAAALLETQVRLLHSNAHHRMWRSQCLLRDALLGMGADTLNMNLLNLSDRVMQHYIKQQYPPRAQAPSQSATSAVAQAPPQLAATTTTSTSTTATASSAITTTTEPSASSWYWGVGVGVAVVVAGLLAFRYRQGRKQ